MNRTEYNELLQEVYAEIEETGGNFQARFGSETRTLEDAKMMAAVALLTVDRFYAKLTRFQSEHPEA